MFTVFPTISTCGVCLCQYEIPRWKHRNYICSDCRWKYPKPKSFPEPHKTIVAYYKRNVTNWLQEYKLCKGCCVCGYHRCPNSLHFHHVDPSVKFQNVSKFEPRYEARFLLYYEVDKCIVICANCHYELEAGMITMSSYSMCDDFRNVIETKLALFKTNRDSLAN